MPNPKQVALELLKILRDDCSFEDIGCHLHIRQLVEEGREDIRQGRVFSQEEIERDLAQWLGQ